ncbi:sensor histidine kinase [Pararobbsia alpina]|uniref:sensor histidine kinase n=1 Tax=Pararobbsia alpina TaxID=621374 RepID=UPI0039A5F739
MSDVPPSATPSAAQTRASRMQSVRLWLWRELRINLSITVVTAVLFATAFRQSIALNLVYSFCIATSIQVLIDLGRTTIGWWLRRNRIDVATTGNTPRDRIAETARRWPGWAFMGPWVTFASITGWYIGERIGDRILGMSRVSNLAIGEPRLLLFTLVCVLSISLGLTYFFYVRGRLASTEVHAEAAMRSAAENQLKLLVSQLEPHMLFNTLANLRVLIGQDPPRAQAMLDHLNGFLRATLDASRVDTHALSAEFDRIADYLELMKVRMGPRLQDSLELPAALGALRVPPLLLQPLVENAIKHGLEPKVAGGRITITADRDGDTLVLTVRDTGVGLEEAGRSRGLHASATTGSRFGLSQVRDRLATLYGEAASLELRDADDALGGTVATVRLPAEDAR